MTEQGVTLHSLNGPSATTSSTDRHRVLLTPTPDRLRGKSALITGGARGIGEAIARRFAQEGADVCIVDKDLVAAEQSAHDVSQLGVRTFAIQADVSDRSAVEHAIEQTVAEMGFVDLLINNAGMIVFGSLLDCKPGDWDRMIAVDLTGAFHFTQLVGRVMIAQGRGGRMIHLGSTASLFPTAQQAAYSVAKAGLMMLSRTAALEFAKYKITSNLLCPQGAVTDINRDLLSDPAIMKALESRIPVGRLAAVEEIAAAAAFLASDEAAFITGTELLHDGGVSISGLWWR
jgi:NAD(P)-dependent dehydrogenase (short-subunit alcohol dehydrogenase family)